MTLIWIVTIGNSDIKLTSNDGWGHLRASKREALDPCYTDFKEPDKEPDKESDSLWSLPARVLGIVYSDALETHWEYFKFPLLSAFTKEIKSNKKNKPDRIIALLTDQTKIFLDTNHDSIYDRSDPDCPYWKDTCELAPILKKYFDAEFGQDIVTFSILEPTAINKGLDNWDETLKLVQQKFADLPDISEDATIYVSHQAGTPAVSSAVQFCSLAKFGDRVRFLVSNENNLELTGFVESSSYLQGIKREQAKKLLENYDYAGLNELVGEYLSGNAKVFLEAAIQWNYAEFEQFRQYLNQENILTQYSLLGKQLEIYSDPNNWWWHAYEAAYLALIRLHQRNAVEAFFHSFRSVEGLISKWTEVTYPEHVDPNNDSPQVKVSILEELPNYLGNKKQEHLLSEFKEKQKLGLHSFPLYDLLRKGKADWKQKCNDLSVFTDQIAPKRNKLFHRLKGLEVSDVFQEWKVNDLEELEIRIRHYLNFISNQSFNSLKEASLMPKVHQELKEAIDKL